MSFPPLIGPQAPERNPLIEPEWFEPSRFPITAISYGTTTTVTTGAAFGISNNYVVGQLIRFLIPKAYGAIQLNNQQAYVISLPAANQIEVDINTTQNYDPFIPSPTYSTTPPSVVAIGNINTGTINSAGRSNDGTTIPGAFINISPSAGG